MQMAKIIFRAPGSSTWVTTAASALDSCPVLALTLLSCDTRTVYYHKKAWNCSCYRYERQWCKICLCRTSPVCTGAVEPKPIKVEPWPKAMAAAQAHCCWTGVTHKQGKLAHAYFHTIKTRSFLRASRAPVYWVTSCGAGVAAAFQGYSQLPAAHEHGRNMKDQEKSW